MVEIKSNLIDIFELSNELSKNNNNFNIKYKRCKDAYVRFLEINRYFGVDVIESRLISGTDAERIKPNLILWINSYGASNEEKLNLLIERLSSLFPKTGNSFQAFLKENSQPVTMAWKLADYMCFSLKKEISEMNDSELECLANRMNSELPLLSARMFSAFLIYAREKNILPNGLIFGFDSRNEMISNDAYAFENFLKMAYVVFNEDAWKKENLLSKALQSQRDANLWLFVALHFICAWRKTDIERLPMPSPPCDGVKMRKMLSEDVLNTDELINELEFRLNHIPMKPNKTKAYSNITTLKLFVPESLKKPFGKILAIAVSHQNIANVGKSFVSGAGDRMHILSFFGKEFLKACDDRKFSSIRANKAYLQGLEISADSYEGKPKGYMIAALARNHKSGFGTLPKTTDVYLRDANFSGYKPEFIAKQMFERGVFSFIPALMMEMYAADIYNKLSIAEQTKLISEIGIKSSKLEEIAKMVNGTIIKANTAIANVMKYPEDIRGNIAEILQNIATGNAPGKQDGFLCLMTAAGLGCPDADRSSCIGCGYAIYTKTILYCLSKEYARLVTLKKDSQGEESRRYAKILKQAIMPAITEMFVSIRRMYPHADLESMIKITEMGALSC